MLPTIGIYGPSKSPQEMNRELLPNSTTEGKREGRPIFQPLLKVIARGEKHVCTLSRLRMLAESDFDADIASDRPDFGSAQILEKTLSGGSYYLGGLLRHAGYPTIAVDSLSTSNVSRLLAADVKVVCISTTYFLNWELVAAAARILREAMPDLTIIVGGVLVWKTHNAMGLKAPIEGGSDYEYMFDRSLSGVDVYVVVPYGGGRILDVLSCVFDERMDRLGELPNLGLHDDHGRLYFTRRNEQDYAGDGEYFHWDLLDDLPHDIPIRSSIGCPYKCAYCDFTTYLSSIKHFNIDSVARQLAVIAKVLEGRRDAHRLIFADDALFISKKSAVQLCNVLIESGVGVPYSGFLRASSVTPELVDIIKRSGLGLASIGVESGDDGVLRLMNKKASVRTMKTGVELLASRGIFVNMSFVAGFPGETRQTLLNTAAFLNELSIPNGNANYHLLPFMVRPTAAIASLEARARLKLKGSGNVYEYSGGNYQTAEGFCDFVARKVHNVTYNHPGDSLAKEEEYGPKTRLLGQLRTEATIKIRDRMPASSVASTLRQIGTLFGRAEVSLDDEKVGRFQAGAWFGIGEDDA